MCGERLFVYRHWSFNAGRKTQGRKNSSRKKLRQFFDQNSSNFYTQTQPQAVFTTDFFVQNQNQKTQSDRGF